MENNFDFSHFNSLSIKERVSYCKSVFGEKLGEGGSRIVFRYDSDKVLKIPKNKFGVAQNLGEITEYRRLANPTMLLPKIYDCDSDNWSYIISEYAKVMTVEEFFEKTGCSNRLKFNDVIKNYINNNIVPNNNFVADFCRRLKDSGIEIRNDIMKRSNVGIRNTEMGEEIIVIDCGVNNAMFEYMNSKRSPSKLKESLGKFIGFGVAVILLVLFPVAYPLTKLYDLVAGKPTTLVVG